MKISKLFHWLYGVIMLLPIFAIGVTSLVSTFNMSAKEESEFVYKYETNEVNSYDDLIVGNIYRFDLNEDFLSDYEENGELEFNILDGYFEFDFQDFYKDETFNPLRFDKNYIIYVGFMEGIINVRIGLSTAFDDYYSILIGEHVFDIVSNNLTILLTHKYNFQNVSAFSKATYNEIQGVETHNVEPQEVFYKAIDKVQQSPLFNWAYNSFLVTPFAYIVSLFSMPTNSFVVMLLSYWLAISIIWLVFDLVMYVPLLIHRWIDKGVLE